MYEDLLNRFVEKSKMVLGADLTGIYLHGSLAMGCFQPEKSDIDLIVVIEDCITDEQKMSFLREVVNLNKEAPDKGIELSVVKKEYCKNFIYPTPFEFHFSNMHLEWVINDPIDYVSKMRGTDKDLAAHFMVINHCGRTLYGEEIASVFSEVPKADYVDSIWNDVAGAEKEILDNPIYMTLNLCRVAAYLKAGLITSKKQGGEWGLQNLKAEYQDLIKMALGCYESGETMIADEREVQAFAIYMLQTIKINI